MQSRSREATFSTKLYSVDLLSKTIESQLYLVFSKLFRMKFLNEAMYFNIQYVKIISENWFERSYTK